LNLGRDLQRGETLLEMVAVLHHGLLVASPATILNVHSVGTVRVQPIL
jgi:hypothetical protein